MEEYNYCIENLQGLTEKERKEAKNYFELWGFIRTKTKDYLKEWKDCRTFTIESDLIDIVGLNATVLLGFITHISKSLRFTLRENGVISITNDEIRNTLDMNVDTIRESLIRLEKIKRIHIASSNFNMYNIIINSFYFYDSIIKNNALKNIYPL